MENNQCLSPTVEKQKSETVRALVKKAKQDITAFEELYRQYVQPIYKYFYNRTNDRFEAEDLTEQTFIAAMEGITNYHERGIFPAWLFTIARKKAADHFRRKTKQSLQEIPEEIPVNSDFLNDIIQSERHQAIAAIFKSLPENDKELIRLRYIADLSFASMGKLLHRSEGAVKKATYRIIQRMRLQLEEKNE